MYRFTSVGESPSSHSRCVHLSPCTCPSSGASRACLPAGLLHIQCALLATATPPARHSAEALAPARRTALGSGPSTRPVRRVTAPHCLSTSLAQRRTTHPQPPQNLGPRTSATACRHGPATGPTGTWLQTLQAIQTRSSRPLLPACRPAWTSARPTASVCLRRT